MSATVSSAKAPNTVSGGRGALKVATTNNSSSSSNGFLMSSLIVLFISGIIAIILPTISTWGVSVVSERIVQKWMPIQETIRTHANTIHTFGLAMKDAHQNALDAVVSVVHSNVVEVEANQDAAKNCPNNSPSHSSSSTSSSATDTTQQQQVLPTTPTQVEMTMRAVIMNGFGAEDVMVVSTDAPKAKITHATDVLVKVHATAVNRADTMQRKGLYPAPPGASEILGLEAAGVVAEVGAGVSKWKVGDRVMGLLSGGGYAEYVPVHEGHLMPIPEQMSFVEAAAVSEVFLTAWQCLRFNMDVQKGDHVLIHAAASGVGTAASQLVERVIGGVAVGTASEGKLEECRKYASHCVSRTVDPESKTQFASKVRAAVGDRINAVIDPVFGGGYLQESVSVCAVDGTITVLAMMGGNTIENYQCSEMFKKRITLRFSTLRGRTDEYKAGLVSSFVEHALPQFAAKDKALVPVISKVLPLEEVREAHRMVGANETIGKVVLTF